MSCQNRRVLGQMVFIFSLGFLWGVGFRGADAQRHRQRRHEIQTAPAPMPAPVTPVPCEMTPELAQQIYALKREVTETSADGISVKNSVVVNTHCAVPSSASDQPRSTAPAGQPNSQPQDAEAVELR